ncbi:hypothetical protein ACFQLX_16085 [Streptomyces polyrhachis]|uniref:Uncharacterized protein n=1 Tax=Streptomyces polyrhachis TaxID=1282885 RepID=A0ABW2GFY7_9ACTN
MDASRIARTFPLVARPRPTCPPLEERVRRLHAQAVSAASERQGEGNITPAVAVLNLAALIASDCGDPHLARRLCWEHADAFLAIHPLSARHARFALEPVVNLARLQIRDGQPLAAYQLLDRLYRTVRARSTAVIADRELALRDLTATTEDQQAVCQWLWTVVLADGTRALAGAGRWSEAHEHAHRHQGIGDRLLDGRQVAVLAGVFEGNPADALTLLEASRVDEPWEQGVAGCLRLLCHHRLNRPTPRAAARAVLHYLESVPEPGLIVFRTRLALTCRTLTATAHPDITDKLTHPLIREVLESGDGYAAREVLRHRAVRHHLKPSETARLIHTVRTAGLGPNAMPDELRRTLLEAARLSAGVVSRAVNSAVNQGD